MVGAGSDMGKEVLKALNALVKLVPAGAVSPAAQKNNIEQMMMRNAQENSQMQALKQQRMQQQPQPGGQAA